MARQPQDVTTAELAVLRELWVHGSLTIRELTDLLYEGEDTQYSTVKKLLERLELKKCISRDRTDMVHRFSALIQRGDLVDKRLREVAETLCEGSITPLLTHAAQHHALTQAQRKMLHALIDNIEQQEE
ncbi:MAG: BlaI family penicillinase repressor [Pirellulaceae bacterium]|jgi:BlaI family penicillinase repressor